VAQRLPATLNLSFRRWYTMIRSRRALTRRALIECISHSCRNATRSFSTRSLLQQSATHSSESLQLNRPYTFHIGTCWAAKPDDIHVLRSRSPFPPDTVIGSWRDRMLGCRKRDPGEDFFFVQEASVFPDSLLPQLQLTSYLQMRNKSVSFPSHLSTLLLHTLFITLGNFFWRC
jgi:hypothetical protein